MSTDNIPRLQDPCNYFFTEPSGERLWYLGTSPSPEDTTWYMFHYTDTSGLHTIEVDDDLNIRLEDSILTTEPYEKVSFYLPTLEFSLLLHTNSVEDMFKGVGDIHVSESKNLGLLNPTNYLSAKKVLGERLLGGINLKVERTPSTLLSVQACPVNEGQIPLF